MSDLQGGHVTLAPEASCGCLLLMLFLFLSQTAGTFAPPWRSSSSRCRSASVSCRGAPGGRLSARPVQPEWDGTGGGGRPDLGEGRLREAGGVPVPRRLPPNLRLHLLTHPRPSVSVGGCSVHGQRGSVPAIFLQLPEPLWEYWEHLRA